MGQQGADWLIRFADNGLGIEPRHVHKIFEPFVRLHPHHEIEGSGVGLATCKSILKRR